MKYFYLLLSLLSVKVNAQIFSQNFNSTGVLSSYTSISPDAGQFNAIGTSGSGVSATIENGRLLFTRTGSNSGSFSRTSDFASTKFIALKFDLEVAGNSASQTTAAVFQFGSGFGTANSAEVNANVHSKIGINFTSNSGQFSLRSIGSSSSSAVFSGVQSITWVINNSSVSQTYTSPSGINETLGADKWDAWVGTTKVFDEVAATSSTQNLSNLKFAFTDGSGSIYMDNVVISEYQTLPVSLASFAAQSLNNYVKLSWSTLAETNCNYFDVLKSTNGKDFYLIGRVKGAGSSHTTRWYSLNDFQENRSDIYYQLAQVDLDGKMTLSKMIQVSKNVDLNFKLNLINEQIAEIILSTNESTEGRITITNLKGEEIINSLCKLSKGDNAFKFPLPDNNNFYVAGFQSPLGSIIKKFVK